MVVLCLATAVAPALAGESPPATHTVAPALTLTATPDIAVAGSAITVAAHIDVPGAVLALSRMRGGETEFTLLRTIVVGADGSASWTLHPGRTTTYRVEFAGDATADTASAETMVSVRPRLTLKATETVYEGWKVTFSTSVVPAHPGATVELQRRIGDVWKSWRTLTLSDESRAISRWTSDTRGSLAFRLAMAADVDHADGASGKRIVLVKDPNPYDVPAGPDHFLVADKSQYRLYYHEHGRVVRVFDCVLGKTSTPTPVGHFKIYAKDSNVGGAYGPRRMRYLGPYAIHGTSEPWLLTRFPRAYSHGCTRLSNTNILWLYERCKVGTQVWNVP